jgi:hypothetical protein
MVLWQLRSAVMAALEGAKTSPRPLLLLLHRQLRKKRRRGRQLGSKNKKPSTATADASDLLDVSFAHPTLPQSSTGNLFSFFAFAGAQCHEQQHLLLKFMELMDARDLREAILWEVSSGRPPYELEVYYDGKGDVFFKGACCGGV